MITASRGTFCAERECQQERGRVIQLPQQLQVLFLTFVSYVILLYSSRNTTHFSR